MSDPLDPLPAASRLRVRTLAVRISLELLAAEAFAEATSTDPKQTQVTTRLLALLPDRADEGTWNQAYLIIKRAQACYRNTSSVLHGRSTHINLSERVVAEWEGVVDQVASLHNPHQSG